MWPARRYDPRPMRLPIAPVLFALLAACGGNPSETPKPGPELPSAVPYDGPELTATYETKESHPPQYTLQVAVHCPTGGWELRCEGLKDIPGGREARFVLTAPAADELVPQGFEWHKESVDLGTERTPVRVLVSQRKRRDAKAAEQPFQFAASVTPK